MSSPRKAYYVQRVSRCVVECLVYADNAKEARRLAAWLHSHDTPAS